MVLFSRVHTICNLPVRIISVSMLKMLEQSWENADLSLLPFLESSLGLKQSVSCCHAEQIPSFVPNFSHSNKSA